jgi:heme A synthase
MFGINPPHWHLLFNHLPVVGSMFSVLLLLYALVRRNSELKRAALLSFVIVGIVTFASITTGGPAAKAIRGMPGVNSPMIREHAESANFAEICSYALGAVSILGLILALRNKRQTSNSANGHAYEAYRRDKEPPGWLMVITLVIGLLQVAIMMRTANLGGEIRHPEIDNDSLSHAVSLHVSHPAARVQGISSVASY